MDLTQELEAEQQEVEKVIESGRAFKMTFNFKPTHLEPAIMIDGQKAIDFGEIMAIVALPSTGKSQIVEMLAAAWVAKLHGIEMDSFGFTFSKEDKRKVLLVDTERIKIDCHFGLDRIYKRLGSPQHLLDKDNGIKGLDFFMFDGLDTDQCKKELDRLLEEDEYGLVIIDGILDFATSLNDEKDSKSLIKDYFRTKASKYSCAMICTIHPNKGTEMIAGHLGGFLYRWCRACLLMRKASGEIREITTDFAQGKLSKANSPVNIYFSWSERLSMMMPSDAPDEGTNHKYDIRAMSEVFSSFILSGKSNVPANELKIKYAERIGKSEKTAEKHIKEALKDELIVASGTTSNRCYRLADDN